jgi:hypothetical protein
MMQVCGDDCFKMDTLGNWGVIDFLTYLKYMKQKGEIELFIKQANGE